LNGADVSAHKGHSIKLSCLYLFKNVSVKSRKTEIDCQICSKNKKINEKIAGKEKGKIQI
jgi:hypothetical protein